jgi:myo-inositol-1(or 4)-monophosphatase
MISPINSFARSLFFTPRPPLAPDIFPTPMTDLALAIDAALAAGKLLRQHFGSDAKVDEATQHDIKLALDKESQELITGILLGARPDDALYGEEGIAGNQDSDRQWIVDPIDGTVNFFYGIPHFCVSIALRVAGEIVVGVIHDPMVGETWTVEKGGEAMLNGRPIRVSARDNFEESILFVGCGKDEAAKKTGIERFHRAIRTEFRTDRVFTSLAAAQAEPLPLGPTSWPVVEAQPPLAEDPAADATAEQPAGPTATSDEAC